MTEQIIPLAEGPVLAPGTTEVQLVGGPQSIPRRIVVPVEEAAYGKVKVPYLAGYEHFVRAVHDDETSNLFSWSTRTKIAE
ncbi:DUF5988 family protein [Actinoplanes sp. NPDC023801]|uniref:DUF5988 family protein n=1 Tax=Actinoplanes sp. NPDC023801 TaxID=3154595 RepID=UPI00340604F4